MKYFPRVRSKNHSVNALRRSSKGLPALPVKSVVRFGSVTPTKEVFKKPTSIPIIEINTIDAVKNSSSKVKMKALFDEAGVSHPEWFRFTKTADTLEGTDGDVPFRDLPYPMVLKQVFGSKGRGMKFIESMEELQAIIPELPDGYRHNYYMEMYKKYVREYRLHCTKDGCFYACRKMLKEGADNRWYRNDSNCVWFLESNDQFDKPTNWDIIESDCVKALKAVGLDIGAFDVRVQSSKKDSPAFAIIEVNSAPAFGDVTEIKYKEILPKLIMSKANA